MPGKGNFMLFRGALLALGLLAAPLHAADVRQVSGCVLGQISAADRDVISEHSLRQEQFPDAVEQRLRAAVTGCAERLAPSTAELEGALTDVLTTLYIEMAGPRLQRAGIPVAGLDGWFDSQSERIRANYGADSMDDNEMERVTASMLQAMEARGVPAATMGEHGALVGGYLAARSLRFRVERGMPME